MKDPSTNMSVLVGVRNGGGMGGKREKGFSDVKKKKFRTKWQKGRKKRGTVLRNSIGR